VLVMTFVEKGGGGTKSLNQETIPSQVNERGWGSCLTSITLGKKRTKRPKSRTRAPAAKKDGREQHYGGEKKAQHEWFDTPKDNYTDKKKEH